jgi:hypothetical protein
MASRSFGALQWKCIRPGSHWTFDDGFGTFHLHHYNKRGQVEGWYLDTPDGSDDWMGRTLSEAAEASQSIVLEFTSNR